MEIRTPNSLENAFKEISMMSKIAVFNTCCWFSSTQSRDSYNLSCNKNYNSKCKEITTILNTLNDNTFEHISESLSKCLFCQQMEWEKRNGKKKNSYCHFLIPNL